MGFFPRERVVNKPAVREPLYVLPEGRIWVGHATPRTSSKTHDTDSARNRHPSRIGHIGRNIKTTDPRDHYTSRQQLGRRVGVAHIPISSVRFLEL